jgi:DNA-3-methyladenine glycosylase I
MAKTLHGTALTNSDLLKPTTSHPKALSITNNDSNSDFLCYCLRFELVGYRKQEVTMSKSKVRCKWCGSDPLYVEYHDKEWGVPVYDDQKLFEFLTLESAQAGLSWITVLRKRENYRKAFAEFDPNKVARFNEKKIEKLLTNEGIIRNRAKINAAVNNAKCFLKIQKEFGSFSVYSWAFVGGQPKINKWKTLKQVPAVTKEAEAFSKDLKSRGFKFVGPTIIYAHMQACGMVNDHTTDCFRYKELTK